MSNSNDPWDGYKGPSLGGEKVRHGFRNVGEIVAAWIDFCDAYPLTAFFGDAERELDYPDSRHYMTAERILQQDKLGQELDRHPHPNTDRRQHLKSAAVVTDLALKLVQSEQQLFREMGIQTEWWEHLSERFGVTRDKPSTKAKPFNYGCDPDDTEELFRELADPDPDADMLPAVRLLIKHLQSIGKEGQRLAQLIEENSEDRSAQWGIFELKRHEGKWQPSPNIRHWIATALWEDVVKPPLERRRSKGTSAIVVGVMNRALAMNTPGTQASGDGRIVRSGIEPPTISGVGLDVPQLRSWGNLSKLRFDRPEFWYTLGALVEGVFESEIRGDQYPDRFHFPDGWKELPEWAASVLEMPPPKSNKAQEEYKRAIRAMATVRMMGNIEGNFLAYNYRPKEKELDVTAGPALSPGFIFTLPESKRLSKPQRRELRQLQPYTKPADMGMFQGTSSVPGLRLGYILVRQMRHNCDDMVKRGGILIREIDLEALTAEANLPASRRNYETLDNWTRDTDNYPAFLEKVDDCIYTLANNERYRDARRFIEDAAKTTLDARRRKQDQRNREQAERDRQKIKPKT